MQHLLKIAYRRDDASIVKTKPLPDNGGGFFYPC